MDVEKFISYTAPLIGQTLDKLVPEQDSSPYGTLFSAARYILLSSGKRLRPLLVLAAAEAFGAPVETALYPACALEMVHTYSLIHDDLPCMDDDDLRRGIPTLHKVYNEGHAVLTGDYLLTYAFQTLAEAPDLEAEQKIRLVHVLSKNAGANGMIGGQVIDIACIGQQINWEILETMHLKKTAAMIAASLEFGGIIGSASSIDLQLLTQAGETLGLAFQIIDDLLDQESSDLHLEKPTAVSLLGPQQAKDYASRLLKQAETLLKQLSVPADLLLQLGRKLVLRTH